MNIFLSIRNLFRETSEKAMVLNYVVINDIMMMQYTYQQIKYFISAKH